MLEQSENNPDLLSEIQRDVRRAKSRKAKPVYVKKESRKKSYLGYKIAYILILLALVTFGVATVAKKVTDWGAEHQIVSQRIVDLQVRFPVRIEKREPIEIISPLAQEVIENKEPMTPVEEKIIDMWGERYGYIALAVFRCESGLNPEAVNWATRDIGIAQINFPTWEKAIKEQFGYTLVDLFDVDKNLEVAKWISDRDGDGKDIDFSAWVVFNNGSFAGCIK